MAEELTPEQREGMREVGIQNLGNETIVNLATANFADGYGDAGASAVERNLYLPTIQSEEASKLIAGSLLDSRQNGKRYSGNVSEAKIIGDCAKIVQESLLSVKTNDLLELMGSDVKAADDYNNKYVSDLKDVNEDVFKNVFGGYIQYLTDAKVSEALGNQAGSTKKGIEKILSGAKEDYEQAA